MAKQEISPLVEKLEIDGRTLEIGQVLRIDSPQHMFNGCIATIRELRANGNTLCQVEVTGVVWPGLAMCRYNELQETV